MESKKLTMCFMGKPTPQRRHRHTRNGRTYDPSISQKKVIRTQLLTHNLTPLTGPLKVDLEFHMPIPKQLRKGRAAVKEYTPHTKMSCDIDNAIKLVLDAMNGIVYKDDSQVYEIRAIKYYSETPKTLVTIDYLC